jgi:hypothetical protein
MSNPVYMVKQERIMHRKNTKNGAIKERKNIYHGTRKISVKGLYGKPAGTSRTGRQINHYYNTRTYLLLAYMADWILQSKYKYK